MANAVKSIAKYIRNSEDSPDAEALRDLCLALESGEPFDLARLYDMKSKAFDLALAVLEEWRFDRHVLERRLQKYLIQEES
ncbi:MAG: hypothetical protein HXY26_07180 [Hydrogenophilaceae bacterium]|nr:hypothetical protein [Hydrogenophilaceae bacterium]